MSDSSNKVRLTDVFDAAKRGWLSNLRTSLPGEVISYDDGTHRATIQLQVMDVDVNGDGVREAVQITPLTDVPIALLGAGGIRIKVKPRKGDQCLVHFCSSSIAEYKSSGKLSDPKSDRHQHLADAIAIPVVLVGTQDAPVVIDIDDVLKLGSSSATQRAVLGDAHLSALSTMVTAIAAAITGITSGAPVGGSAAGTAITAALTAFQSASSTYLSQIVKLV